MKKNNFKFISFWLCASLVICEGTQELFGQIIKQNNGNNSTSLSKISKGSIHSDLKQFNQLFSSNGLRFTENIGQVADINGGLRHDILFTAHNEGVKLFLTVKGIHYQFRRDFVKKVKANEIPERPGKPELDEMDSTQYYRFNVGLKGANPYPEIIKDGVGVDVENFFLAHCPDGILGVKNYNRITYKEVYPNIDWVVYVNEGKLEYDFVVRPGGKIDDIKLQYNGAENLALDKNGALHIKTRLGKVVEQKPFSFQQEGREVASGFVLEGNTIGFDVPSYNENKILIIDPIIEWATYYGGSGYDYGRAVTTDAAGNIYLTGYTKSATGIASGGHQNTILGTDMNAFLVKFNATGVRQWATYYGAKTWGHGVVTDLWGNVYLQGTTFTSIGIASGGHQNTYGGGTTDAFLVKFNSAGNRLWATYYGGSNFDYGNAVACDNIGNVLLSGYTRSYDAIANGGHQNTGTGGGDYLVKFNTDGVRQWGTYYGGMSEEYGGAFVATDKDGNAYLAGSTSYSSSIAYLGHRNTFSGGAFDGYLVKFNASGVRQWATYYGGPASDRKPIFVATDALNNVFIAGHTSSTADIASGGYQNTKDDGNDAYLVKFNSAGVRQWGTYYGGSGNDYGYAVSADGSGSAYLAGYTTSTSGIASGGVQNSFGGGSQDAFLVKFNNSGVRQWGSYYGGSGIDVGYYLANNSSNDLFMAGYTNSTTGISSGGHQNSFGGGEYDGFLVKIPDGPPSPDTDGDGVLDVNDCAPNDITKYLNANLYIDADNDGYDAGQEKICYGATIPQGYKISTLGSDCDDENNAVHEGSNWYKDADNDGYSNGTNTLNCERPVGYKLASELISITGDCDDANNKIHPATIWYLDTDNDGYGNGTSLTQCTRLAKYKLAEELTAISGDCNNNDATIHPNAVEQCDSKDNNCDGQIDEGCGALTTWYRDNDGDGWGRTNWPIISVAQPRGYVNRVGDCNDGDATIYPTAPELCDGKDNNCNSQVDESLPGTKTWYRDADGDGRGHTKNPKVSCVQPAGYVNNTDDCNDGDATIYLGAPELCDGKDNDCDGKKDEECGLITGTKQAAKSDVLGEAFTVNLWPNPARSELMVSLNGLIPNQKLEMVMMTADGRAVQSQSIMPVSKDQQVRLGVRSLATGYYLLRISQEKLMQTKKVMIVR